MKKSILITLFLIPHVYGNTCVNRNTCTFISPRSPSVDAARELAGWENQINQADGKHGSFAITPEVTLSFRPERIAQCFFGDDIITCKNIVTIAGSQVSERSSMAWLADYFGLPTDYKSRVHFNPKMSNALLDLNWFCGSNNYLPGMYFRIHAPIVYTRWDLTMCETLITTGSNTHDPGYFNASGIPRVQLVDNFTQFIGGLEAPKADGLTFHKLRSAKMSCPALRFTQLSDIQMALGWNALHTERYHVGFNIRTSIPTGNRPDGEYLFEPIIGNGHHWELGGGLSTHIVVWENEETQEKAAFYLDANITHLFTTRQTRSFDVHGSSNSRYMLAQKMDKEIQDNLRGTVNAETIEPKYQYAQEISPIANLTTLPVDVSIKVQADLVAMVAYTQEKNSWTFGYNFWGRSCECITLHGKKTPFDIAPWAIKGDAYVFGFEDTMLRTPVALSATQSEATINSGKNFPKTGADTELEIAMGQLNLAIDNPAPAVSDSTDSGSFVSLQSQPGGADAIRTSIQPIILKTKDINIDSARTRGISHKIFSSFTHMIYHRELQPYIGFGAEMEFGQSSESKKNNINWLKPCINTALSFWGVWLKGGVAF